jgi:hypothetical protein
MAVYDLLSVPHTSTAESALEDSAECWWRRPDLPALRVEFASALDRLWSLEPAGVGVLPGKPPNGVASGRRPRPAAPLGERFPSEVLESPGEPTGSFPQVASAVDAALESSAPFPRSRLGRPSWTA